MANYSDVLPTSLQSSCLSFSRQQFQRPIPIIRRSKSSRRSSPNIYSASPTFHKSDPSASPSIPTSFQLTTATAVHSSTHSSLPRSLETDKDHHPLHFSHTKWQQTRNHLQISYLFPITVRNFISRPNSQLPTSISCRSKIYPGDFPR